MPEVRRSKSFGPRGNLNLMSPDAQAAKKGVGFEMDDPHLASQLGIEEKTFFV